MKRYLTFILLASSILASTSCGKEEKKKAEGDDKPVVAGIDEQKVASFILLEDIGVYGADLTPTLVFDKLAHELVYNVRLGRLTMQDDDLQPLLTVDLTADGEDSFTVDIKSAAVTANCTMKLVRAEGDTAWLWDTENNLGIIILKES